MMSNIPVFETIGIINGTNPAVQVAPMEQTVVKGNFNAWSPTDRVEVALQAGETLTAGLDVNYPAIGTNFGSALKVYSGTAPSSPPRPRASTSSRRPIRSPAPGPMTTASLSVPRTPRLYTVEADEKRVTQATSARAITP